jgi:rod shape-determining protein MreD
MKGWIAVLVIVFVALLLRSTALTGLAARGVVLDVLALATVLWSLSARESWGATLGFVLGLAADLDASHWMGRHALALSLIGYAVGRLSHTLVRNSARTQATLLAIATAAHQTWVASFEVGSIAAWPYLAQRVILATIVTAAAGTGLIALARRAAGTPLFRHGNIEFDPAD